jgi:uncharacterized protein
MKIFIDIGHPAHVHYFRNFINLMQEKRHDFFITARNKEVAQTLLTNYKIQYKSRGKGKKSLMGKLMYIVQGDHVLYKYAKMYHPDLFLSFGSPYAAQVSKLLGKHHIAFYDTEHALLEHTMYAPFTNTILTPSCFFKNFGSKQIFFNGYMELCYLHPRWFTPNPGSLKYLNIKKDEKYIVFRYVSWNASHDFMKNGLTLAMKRKLISELSKYGKILISSEEELPKDLKKYKINIPPEKMHDVLHYATLFIGEGATMASECAMIGTPAIYINPLTSGTIKEQEKYGLLYEFSNSNGVLEKAVELLSTPNLKKEWQKRRQEMLQDKIDVTTFMVWFIENYPESKKIMKEFPEYQNEFRINRKSRIYGNKINSRKKLFLNNNLISNSEIISKGHLFEIENSISIRSEMGSGNYILNNANNNNINSDSFSKNLSDRNDDYLPVNYRDLPDFIFPEDKLILPKSEPPNQFLLKRIYNIFFKLLDDDIRLLNIKNIDPAITLFILKYVKEVDSSVILETNVRTHINNLQDSIQSIVNIQKINDIRYINKFFESVNNKLVQNGIFIGSVETFKQRKKRIFKKYPSLLAIPYYAMDFIFKRAFPKFYLTKKLYYSITKGRNRLISLSETLGRLVSCGYEIIGYEEINNLTYFAAKRTGEPVFDKTPSYGLFIQLKRIGKNGDIFNVLKFRTMHPFSEYLQEYIYKNNHLNGSGKFNRDFRITTWGNLLRKYWLDELPMLWNFLKGDLKLFGVRPLSVQYYNMYDEDIRMRRIKYKPGLIPPYFADLPKTFEEIMDSERKYLDNYDAHPFKTDWKYFWKVFYNIIFKRVKGG